MTIVEVSQVLISGISGRDSTWMVDDPPAVTLPFLANDKRVSTIHQFTDPPTNQPINGVQHSKSRRISFNLIIFNNQRIAHASHCTKELAKSIPATTTTTTTTPTRTTRINPLMEPAWRVFSARLAGEDAGQGRR